jgi:hypothetical protein
VLGANTYRAMEQFAAEAADHPDFRALTARSKLVISRTLQTPLNGRTRRSSPKTRSRPSHPNFVHTPSEITSTEPSTTLMAVCSSMA